MQTLPRRLSHCVSKGEHFECGDLYVSILDQDGNRKDYCVECWEHLCKPVTGHFWRGKIPLKKEKVHTPDEKALALFRQTEVPKERYILALYLTRKHQLLQRTSTIYEIPETGEIFNVERLSLTPEEGKELVAKIVSTIDGLAL